MIVVGNRPTVVQTKAMSAAMFRALTRFVRFHVLRRSCGLTVAVGTGW